MRTMNASDIRTLAAGSKGFTAALCAAALASTALFPHAVAAEPDAQPAVAAAPGAGIAAAPAAGMTAARAEIGKPAPDFTLKDTDGKEHRLGEYTKEGKMVVLEWFNPDCPYSRKHHVTFHTMTDLEGALRAKNVVWLAVNSGAPGKQGAGLERNRKAKADYSMEYPILLDQAGVVGKEYGAKTTPHMFVIAPDGTLIYKGAIDDDRRPDTAGKTNYVRAAVGAYDSGKKVDPSETMSYGCSVKYAD